MKKLISLFVFSLLFVCNAVAEDVPVVASTIDYPVVYNVHNVGSSSYYWNMRTGASTSEKGRFIFIASETPNAYYIYNLDSNQYIGYTQDASYASGKDFAQVGVQQLWFFGYDTTNNNYLISPYTSTASVASIYMNWNGGAASNTGSSNTMGLWTGTDNSSKWGFEMVDASLVSAVCDNSFSSWTYGKGSLSSKTFTSNAASGLAGVTFTVTGSLDQATVPNNNNTGARSMAVKPGGDGTYSLSITAPDGYLITGYELGAYCYGTATYTLTAATGSTATISSTTFSGNTPSLSVSGLADKTTTISYSSSAGTSVWLFVPWFKVYLMRVTALSEISAGSVYSLYNVYSDGAFPVYNNSGTPSISTSTSADPQLFVMRTSETSLTGASLYNLQKAEGDGNYLTFATGNRTHSFSTTKSDYLFLNASSSAPTGVTQNGTRVSDPYTHFYGYFNNGIDRFPPFRGDTSNGTDITADNSSSSVSYGMQQIYGTTSAYSRTANNERYNYRWLLKPAPYTAYNLVVQDAGGTPIDGVSVTYSNSADADITRSAQQNGGFFVIKNDVTPTLLMFSLSNSPTYKITNFSLSGTTITITVASSATTSVGEGRYYIKNRGRNKWLRQESDAIGGTDACGTTGYVWDVIASGTANQYYIRNEADGRYIKKAIEDNVAYTLVENKSDATRVEFSTTEIYDEGVSLGCVAIVAVDGNEGPKLFNMKNGEPYGIVRWYGKTYSIDDAANEWFFYIADVEEDIELLIQNTRSSKYATYGADDDAQLVQNAAGEVDATKSIWTLTAYGTTGYRLSNGGSAGKFLSDPRGVDDANPDRNTFSVGGRLWYIQDSPYNALYYSVSMNSDGGNCLNDAGRTKVTIYSANDEGSCWRFITPDQYYWDAVDYINELYDADHNTELFYLSASGYAALKALAHGTTVEKISAANAMYSNLPQYFNMPVNGKDYLVKNNAGYYMNTLEDGTKLGLVSTYNSSFFWNVEKASDGRYYMKQSCYGTTGGQYPDGGVRYINSTQGDDNADWVYITSKSAAPLRLEPYGRQFVAVGDAVATSHYMHCNYGLAQWVRTWWDKSAANNRWLFVTVEEASVGLIAAANAAIAAAASSDAEFTLTDDAVDDIEEAIDNLETTPNYVNYYILEQLLNASNSYYQLESGRYLVRNYAFDTNGDGNPEDKEAWLTSMVNPVSVVEDAICYWSIWDITNLGNGQYTMVCQGNRDILAPTKTLESPAAEQRDEGKFFYQASSSHYQVGTPTGSDDATLLFYPAVAVSPSMSSAAPVSGSYAAISVASQVGAQKYLCLATHNDHIAIYSSFLSENRGDGFFWQFIPVKNENEINHEGTHSGESEMFVREVNGLAGYVGGVVTLDNVESVAPLNDIVQLRNAAVNAMDNGTALSYTSTYDGVVTASDNAAMKGAVAFRAILEKIQNIKNGTLPAGYSTMTAAEVKKLYQDLRPTEDLGDGNQLKHPFFLENMCGTRPAFGARLTERNGISIWKDNVLDTGDSWGCSPKDDVTNTAGSFYVTRETGEAGAFGNNATYSLQNGNGNWLEHGDSTKTFRPILQTNTEADKMLFYIDPVIPGVWQIRDSQTSGASADTKTQVTVSSDGLLRYYWGSEISSLWKFQTFNELDTIFVKPSPSTQYNNNYFCTFSYPLNVKIPKAGTPIPYYCVHAYRSANDNHTNYNLKAVFTAMPDDGEFYYLEGNQGYMFMAVEGSNINSENISGVKNEKYNPSYPNALYIADAEYLSGGIPAGCAVTTNILKANLYTTYITDENWAGIYGLSYVTPGTVIGSYYGTPVKGDGMGFYHIRIGGHLNPGTAYLPSSAFTPDDSEVPASVHESNMPAEIVIEDEDGNIVNAIDILPDGTWQSQLTDDSPIYDLTGRRVTNPAHGVYIQNGKKVMYK